MTPGHEMTGTAAIITGGSRGIGFAIARELLLAGAGVCITARKVEGVEASS